MERDLVLVLAGVSMKHVDGRTDWTLEQRVLLHEIPNSCTADEIAAEETKLL